MAWLTVRWTGSDAVLMHQVEPDTGFDNSRFNNLLYSSRGGAWSVIGGVYDGFGAIGLTPWVQEATYSYPSGSEGIATRFWYLDTHYLSCHASGPAQVLEFRPTGSQQTTNGNVSSVSTVGSAAVTSNCDYTDAVLHNGWGWDPVARESCPPVNVSAAIVSGGGAVDLCVDLDGDG